MAAKRTATTSQLVRKRKAASKRPAARSNGMLQRRADLGMDVGVYFAGLTAAQRAIAQKLDAAVWEAVPKASAAIKWGMPVYEHHGMLCYIRARPAYVAFGFYEAGTSLDDPKNLLEGSGQNMRHVKCPLGTKVDVAYMISLVKQAARINELD